MTVAVTGILCRTSDRTVLGSQGAEALARALSKRVGVRPTLHGTPGQVRDGYWEQDLAEAQDCLRDTKDGLERVLSEHGFPVLVACDCTLALATLPALARARPDAWVLWIDAHGDFNSPDTTTSGYLAGMALAGACGIWETGMGIGPHPSRVVLCGARALDPDERNLLDASAVRRVPPERAGALVRGKPLYVHLDLDVLDPSVLPGSAFPVPGGLGEDQLTALLREVAEGAEVVGCEICALTAPELAGRMAELVTPLVAGR